LNRFRPAPEGGTRLVCLPHAGGSASFYLPVAQALAGRVDVVAVQYPGRQERRREPVVTSLPALADRLVPVVAPLLDRPVALFGHSMGAVLGFELALRLEAAGQRLRRLFVSGRRGPSAHRDECFHRLDDPSLVAELRRLNGTDSAILGDAEMLGMILPAVRGDLTAIETYRCAAGSTVGCPITVLVGDDDPRTTVDEARSWAGHTTGGSELFVLPGGHFYLVRRGAEVIDIVAARLESPRPE